jgi:hypothetical protein
MTQDKPDKPLLRRLRRIPGEIGDAARTVTGHSASEDMAEFTDAYADVLQGLHSEVTAFGRRLQAVEVREPDQVTEVQKDLVILRQEVARLKKTLMLTVAAVGVGLAIAIAALVIALL